MLILLREWLGPEARAARPYDGTVSRPPLRGDYHCFGSATMALILLTVVCERQRDEDSLALNVLASHDRYQRAGS